jgi:hypothetical protein
MSVQPHPVGAAEVAQPPVRGTFVEELTAEFIVRVDRQVQIFYVRAERSTDVATGSQRLRGEAFRGTCTNGLCGLSGLPVKVTHFEIADDSSWATIRLEDADHTHRLRFVAVDRNFGAPSGPRDNPCRGQTVVQDLGNWNAQAQGEVFGRRVSTAAEAGAHRRGPESIETSLHLKTCPP